jgi:hypothetical protein
MNPSEQRALSARGSKLEQSTPKGTDGQTQRVPITAGPEKAQAPQKFVCTDTSVLMEQECRMGQQNSYRQEGAYPSTSSLNKNAKEAQKSLQHRNL